MKGRATEPGQKRPDRCVLEPRKWGKMNEGLGKPTCGTFSTDDHVADISVRVENARKNGQTHPNTKLLGKCQLK